MGSRILIPAPVFPGILGAGRVAASLSERVWDRWNRDPSVLSRISEIK